jgi:hypothetical protein
MELDLQRQIGLQFHATGCAQLFSLAETPYPPPPTSRIWAHIRGAILVSKDSRHLLVTPYENLLIFLFMFLCKNSFHSVKTCL